MRIECVTVTGLMAVNCYFLTDGDGHGFVIDPGAEGEALAELIRKRGWTVEAILLTHGHFDHIGGAEAIREAFGIPVKIHENGARILTDPAVNLSGLWGTPCVIRDAEYFRGGDLLTLNGKPALRVIHTPGHTSDSVIFLCEDEKTAFVGDTIFKGTYGATHFPTGDWDVLMHSIREKVLSLPDDTVLLSGHTEATTVGAERRYYR